MLEGQQRPRLHNYQNGEHREGDNADPEYSKPKAVVFLRSKGKAHLLNAHLAVLIVNDHRFFIAIAIGLTFDAKRCHRASKQ